MSVGPGSLKPISSSSSSSSSIFRTGRSNPSLSSQKPSDSSSPVLHPLLHPAPTVVSTVSSTLLTARQADSRPPATDTSAQATEKATLHKSSTSNLQRVFGSATHESLGAQISPTSLLPTHTSPKPNGTGQTRSIYEKPKPPLSSIHSSSATNKNADGYAHLQNKTPYAAIQASGTAFPEESQTGLLSDAQWADLHFDEAVNFSDFSMVGAATGSVNSTTTATGIGTNTSALSTSPSLGPQHAIGESNTAAISLFEALESQQTKYTGGNRIPSTPIQPPKSQQQPSANVAQQTQIQRTPSNPFLTRSARASTSGTTVTSPPAVSSASIASPPIRTSSPVPSTSNMNPTLTGPQSIRTENVGSKIDPIAVDYQSLYLASVAESERLKREASKAEAEKRQLEVEMERREERYKVTQQGLETKSVQASELLCSAKLEIDRKSKDIEKLKSQLSFAAMEGLASDISAFHEAASTTITSKATASTHSADRPHQKQLTGMEGTAKKSSYPTSTSSSTFRLHSPSNSNSTSTLNSAPATDSTSTSPDTKKKRNHSMMTSSFPTAPPPTMSSNPPVVSPTSSLSSGSSTKWQRATEERMEKLAKLREVLPIILPHRIGSSSSDSSMNIDIETNDIGFTAATSNSTDLDGKRAIFQMLTDPSGPFVWLQSNQSVFSSADTVQDVFAALQAETSNFISRSFPSPGSASHAFRRALVTKDYPSLTQENNQTTDPSLRDLEELKKRVLEEMLQSTVFIWSMARSTILFIKSIIATSPFAVVESSTSTSRTIFPTAPALVSAPSTSPPHSSSNAHAHRNSDHSSVATHTQKPISAATQPTTKPTASWTPTTAFLRSSFQSPPTTTTSSSSSSNKYLDELRTVLSQAVRMLTTFAHANPLTKLLLLMRPSVDSVIHHSTNLSTSDTRHPRLSLSDRGALLLRSLIGSSRDMSLFEVIGTLMDQVVFTTPTVKRSPSSGSMPASSASFYATPQVPPSTALASSSSSIAPYTNANTEIREIWTSTSEGSATALKNVSEASVLLLHSALHLTSHLLSSLDLAMKLGTHATEFDARRSEDEIETLALLLLSGNTSIVPLGRENQYVPLIVSTHRNGVIYEEFGVSSQVLSLVSLLLIAHFIVIFFIIAAFASSHDVESHGNHLMLMENPSASLSSRLHRDGPSTCGLVY